MEPHSKSEVKSFSHGNLSIAIPIHLCVHTAKNLRADRQVRNFGVKIFFILTKSKTNIFSVFFCTI